MLLGIIPGLASLWLGRAFEWTALRVVDALMTLPFTLFAIAAVGVFGNGLSQAMLALGVLLAPLFFRVSRAAALGLKQAQYVEAAELMGASRGRVLRTHIVAKVLPTIAVTTAHALATALLTVTSLTFLGVGVQPPAPTWGGVLASDLGYLAQQPWAPALPGLLIMVTVGALNLLADAVRDSGAVDAADSPAERDPSTGSGGPGRKWAVRLTRPASPEPSERRTDERVTV
jgi:peptide/nickel transport system permease protein